MYRVRNVLEISSWNILEFYFFITVRTLTKVIRLSDTKPFMFLVSILQTAHLWANTGVVFRELSFSRLECGVHDRLHIYPLCGIFYFPWHRHQIEGTNGFYCLIRKTERFTISNVESQVFTPRIIMSPVHMYFVLTCRTMLCIYMPVFSLI